MFWKRANGYYLFNVIIIVGMVVVLMIANLESAKIPLDCSNLWYLGSKAKKENVLNLYLHGF